VPFCFNPVSDGLSAFTTCRVAGLRFSPQHLPNTGGECLPEQIPLTLFHPAQRVGDSAAKQATLFADNVDD